MNANIGNTSTLPIRPTQASTVKTSNNRNVSSITELQNGNHGDFKIRLDNEVVYSISNKCKSLFVSHDGFIYSTDLHAEEFKKVQNIVKNVLGKFEYRLVTQEVLTFILSQQSQGFSAVEKDGVETDSSDAQKLWKSLIRAAHELKASDIHLKIKPNGMFSAVFFRIHGLLRPAIGFGNLSGDQLIRMMNAAVNFDAHKEGGDASKQFTLSKPNDSKVPVNFENGENIQIRVGVMPGSIPDTGKVSLRLLAVGASGVAKSYRELGFEYEQCELITEALQLPYGAILFTGPTGSGKSTAVLAGLKEIDKSKHVITIENPIENIVDNDSCIQCAVNEDVADLTFSNLLRSSLRNDPDVIFVGEVRENEIARTAARAAQTGHLMLSTLHVNHALEVPEALEHYGLELHKITERSFLRFIVAQRLVPALCIHCKIPLSQVEKVSHGVRRHVINRITEYFKNDIDSIYITNPVGCSMCHGFGVKDRKLIAEVVKIDRLARECILNRDSERWRRELTERGWRDMKYHAELRVKKGEICPVNVESELLTPFGTDTTDDDFNYSKFREAISSK